jgi:hypothetical protein
MVVMEDAPNFGPDFDIAKFEPKTRMVPHVSWLLKDIGIVPHEFPQLIEVAQTHSDEYMRWELNRQFFGARVTGNVTENTTNTELRPTGFEGYYLENLMTHKL